MIPTELFDDRLLLRAPTMADVEAITVICQDPEITRWIGAIPLAYTEQDAAWFVAEMADRGWETGQDLVWLLTRRSTGAVLGTIGLHLRSPGVAEVGFLLGQAARGHGYMTDAVGLVCAYAFGVLDLHRVEWQAVVGNYASRAVAERCGFSFEGTLRGRLMQHDGSGTGERAPADAWMAARLAPAVPDSDRRGATPVATSNASDEVAREGSVVLRRWRSGDADEVTMACQDPQIARWTLVPTPYSRADAELYLAGEAARWERGLPGLAAVDPTTGQLLGSFGVVQADAEEGPEVGYWVAPWARGRGIATDALRALCRWLLDEQAAPRVRWKAEVGNIASLRTAEAVGFVVEGTARQALRHGNQRVAAWFGSLLPGQLRPPGSPPVAATTVPRAWPHEPVELRTRRLLLRAYRESDAATILSHAHDEAVRAWNPIDLSDHDGAMSRVRHWADWSAGKAAAWAVADAADSRLLGGVTIHSLDSVNNGAEIGYSLVAAERGHGYAAEAVTAVTGWAFATLPVQRIELLHAVANVDSCGVAERAGYALEGTLRKAYRYGDGQLHDEHLHARLATDPPPA
jgi:RimJ/RimL family protein N-acetyltransferase